jgi:hypothetical protein
LFLDKTRDIITDVSSSWQCKCHILRKISKWTDDLRTSDPGIYNIAIGFSTILDIKTAIEMASGNHPELAFAI